MLQLYPVYLLWNRRKTLTGSPDPTCANGTNRPCRYIMKCGLTGSYNIRFAILKNEETGVEKIVCVCVCVCPRQMEGLDIQVVYLDHPMINFEKIQIYGMN